MTTSRVGPLESQPWPEQLDAHAVTPSGDPCLFGYDVDSDLARHYRFADILYLSVTGELPTETCSRAFDMALTMLAPMSSAEYPIHAAALSRICGARPSGVLSIASAAVAEHAAETFRACSAYLADPALILPPELEANDETSTRAVLRLAGTLEGMVDVPLLTRRPRRDVALLAVLWACGLRTEMQIVTVVTLARLVSAMAESLGRRPMAFGDYPTVGAPPFVYEGS